MNPYRAFEILKEGKKFFCVLKSATPESPAVRQKCAFVLIQAPPDGYFFGNLDEVIYKNGGVILEENDTSENAVTILDEFFYYHNPDQDCVLPPDTFSSVYLRHVEKARKASTPPPDLNRYRLTASKYHRDCDANKVLFYERKWSDFPEDSGQQQQQHVLKTAQEAVAMWRESLEAEGITQTGSRSSVWERSEEVPSMSPKVNVSKLRADISGSQQLDKDVTNGMSSTVAVGGSVEEVANLPLNLDGGVQSVGAFVVPHSPSAVAHDESPVIMPLENGKRGLLKVLETESQIPVLDQSSAVLKAKKQQNPSSCGSSSCTATSGSWEIEVIDLEPPSEDDTNEENTSESSQSISSDPTWTSAASDNTAEELDSEDGDSDDESISEKDTVDGDSGREVESISDDTEDSDIEEICRNVSQQSSSSDESTPTRGRYNLRSRGSPPPSHDGSDDVDIESASSSNTSLTVNGAPFTLLEGQQILNLLCLKKAFLHTNGNRVWQLMLESDRFLGRTFQSLKEHYRKQILPNVLKRQKYKITETNLKLLKKAQIEYKLNRHANSCPNYKF